MVTDRPHGGTATRGRAVVALACCGLLVFGAARAGERAPAPVTGAEITAPAEIDRHLSRLAEVHDRGGSAGAVAALRSLESLRKRLGVLEPSSAPDERSMRGPHGWLRHVLDAGSGLEAVLARQHDRVVQQLAGRAASVFCQCYCDEACDDGYFCDGAERCHASLLACVSGTAPSCDDSDECTFDSCNEGTDRCDHDPVPPPAEVGGLELALSDPSVPIATLAWQPDVEADSYNVYRGTRHDLADVACFLPGVTGTTTDDDGSVAIGGLFVYLVTAEHCGESTLGNGTGPAPPRIANVPCP